MDSAESIKLEYRRALMDLKENSKVRINVLTMLAEENAKYAEMIVGVIQNHIRHVNSASRLYVLYLVDSIIKNSGDPYTTLLANCLGDIFLLIFKEGNEKTRESLFRLRTTWNPFFSTETLYAMDVRVKEIDPAWPVADHAPTRRPTVLEISPTSAPGNGADFARTAVFRYQSGHLSNPYSAHCSSNMIDTKPPKPIYVGPKILTSKPLKVNPAVTQKALEARRQAALMRQQREQLRMEFERQLAKERAEILAKQKELEEKEREINDQRHMLSQQSWQLERDRAARNVTKIINTAESHSFNNVPAGCSGSKPRAVDVEHSSVLRHDQPRQATGSKTLKRSSDQLQDSFQSAGTSSSKILPKSPNKSKFSSKPQAVNESHQLPQCSSEKGIKSHHSNPHVTTRGIKPRSGKPKFVAKHQPDRPFRARNRSIKERKTAGSKDLDRSEIVEIVTVDDDKSCRKHSTKHRNAVGIAALSLGKSRDRGGAKSPTPSSSKKSEKKKMETKSKSRSKVKQTDSSPAQLCEPPLAAVSQVTMVGCGLEEEMDDDVEVVREIGCAPGIVIKIENCEASVSHPMTGQQSGFIDQIKERSLVDRNQALPPKKRKRYSFEKDNWDCQPSRIMPINTIHELRPNEQIAVDANVMDGFSDEAEVAGRGEHRNGPFVSASDGNTMDDCIQADADEVLIEDGFAGFDEDEIECFDIFNQVPGDGINNENEIQIDAIGENVSDAGDFNNQIIAEERVSEIESSNAGTTDGFSNSLRQRKMSFFSEPTKERSICEYFESCDAAPGRTRPRPPSLLDIVIESERNGIVGNDVELMQYGQYSIDEFSRPPRGRAELGNFLKGLMPGPAEPSVALPPVLPKPKPLLQGYLTKPKPVNDDDQKPDVSGTSFVGRDGPNRPLFRFRSNRGRGPGGRNIEWLRYKTNRFAIGCHVYDQGELDSPNMEDNSAVEDCAMPDNNDDLYNDQNADETLDMTEQTLPANQDTPEESAIGESTVGPPPIRNDEFRDNVMPFRPEVPPFRGGPQFNRPPRPRFPYDEPYRGPPRQNWTRPPRQPVPRKQPKKPKDPYYILVMEQAHRLVNAAEHKLKAGEIGQEDYDSIMKDLRRLNRYRRPGYPHYHLSFPRRQPLLNEQDERSLMHQPQQSYNPVPPYYQFDADSGQSLMSQGDSVGTDPDLPEGAVKEELDGPANRSLEIPDGHGSTPIPTSNQAFDPMSPTNAGSIAAPPIGVATVPVGMTQSNATGIVRPRPPLGAILPPPPPIGFRPNIYDPNLLQPRALQPGVPLLLPRNHIIPPPGIHPLGGSPGRATIPVPPGLGVPPIGYFPFSCPTISPSMPVGPDINQQNRTDADSAPSDNTAGPSAAPRAPELSQLSNGNIPQQSSGLPNSQIPMGLSRQLVIMPPPDFEQTNPSFRKPSPVGGKSSVSPSGAQGETADEMNIDSAATECKRKGSDSSDKQDNGDDDDDAPQVIVPSKTIFVDGRPYEVLYIGEAAVIERSGLPHRVYFQGPPREVVIDGTAYMLAFQEQKTVTIDGQSHSLMFGAPARELILGGFPLRGNFGGAPVFIKIKGITHKIQICGPPPMVKIDPEPDYELYRFMPNQQMKHNNYRPMFESGAVLRPGMPMPPMPMPPPGFLAKLIAQGMLVLPPRFPPPGLLNPNLLAPNMPPLPGVPPAPASLNVSDLLDRLVKAGLVPRTESTSSGVGTTSTASISNSDTQSTSQSATPQTMSGPRTAFISQGVAPTERRQRSTQVLKEFNMRDLRVRYQSEIDSLYVYGLQCDNCGMRYGEGDADRYSQHLDWHFQFHRRSKTVQAHGWLIALEDWIRYDEMGEEAANAKHMVFESLADTDDTVHSVEDETWVDARDCPVLFAPDEEQSCEVCGEAFIAYYDGSDDSWKIRNVIEVDAKLYHPICHQDASQQQESSVEEIMPATSGDEAPQAPAVIVKKELMDPSFAAIADTAFNIIETLKSAARPSTSSLAESVRHGNVAGKQELLMDSNVSCRPSTSNSTDNPSDSNNDIHTDDYSSLSRCPTITGGRPASSCGASGVITGTTAETASRMTRTESSPELRRFLFAGQAPTSSVICLEGDDTSVPFSS